MTEREPDNAPLNEAEREFAQRAGRQLRRSAEALDAATVSRLNRARQKALDEAFGESSAHSNWWVATGVAALVAAVAIGVWRPGERGGESVNVEQLMSDDVSDVEILLDDGELEMLEDLEFFAWLAGTDMETSG